MKIYVVISIGCLECGVASKIIAVSYDEEEAKAIRHRAEEEEDVDAGATSIQVLETKLPPIIIPV